MDSEGGPALQPAGRDVLLKEVAKLRDLLAASQRRELHREEVERSLSMVYRALRVLRAFKQHSPDAQSETELATLACRTAVDNGGYVMAWVGYADPDGRVTPVAQWGDSRGYLDTIEVRWTDHPLGRGPAGTAIRTKKPCLVNNLDTNEQFTIWRDQAKARSFKAILGLPLVHNEHVYGALTIYSPENDAFDEDEQQMLQDLASDLAFGISRLRELERLSRERSEFISIFDSIHEAVYIADPDTHEILYANNAMTSLFGNILGHKCYQAIQGKDAPCDFCTNHIIMRKAKTPYVWEYFNHSVERWVRCIDMAIDWPDGRLVRYQMAQDITDLRQAEENLQRFRNALDSSAESIFLIALETMRCIDVNETACSTLGYAREELLYMGLHDILPEFSQTDFAEFLDDLVRSDTRSRIFESRHRRKDGSTFIAEVALRAMPDTDEPLVLVTTRDITSRITYLRELERARDLAQAANTAKGQFLATMSHEIRTPMNGILGMTELCLDTSLDTDQREYLETVRTSAQSLLTLINDILDFSRIDAGKVTLQLAPFSLRESIASVFALMKGGANDKGLALHADIAPDVPDCLLGDSNRFRQICINLINNAIKFTDAGDITLTIAADPDTGYRDPNTAYLNCSVLDTGKGIPPDKLEEIFHLFTQADTCLNRQHQGTGLGLAICRKLVSIMDGRIWAENGPDGGALFRFTLALPTVEADALEAVLEATACSKLPAPPQANRLRILVAEDNPVNQRLTQVLLDKLGHYASVAKNGQHALDMAIYTAFDLVLMDVEMPEMDGVEATRAIRCARTAKTSPTVPIVAMTAHVMRDDKERYMAAGMSGYLPKPIDMERLRETIQRVLESREQPPVALLDGRDDEQPSPTWKPEYRKTQQRARGSEPQILVYEDDGHAPFGE